MLPDDDEVYGIPLRDRYPGPLAEPVRVTLWKHTQSQREYLAIVFNTGARVVLNTRNANRVHRILEAWRSPMYKWPHGLDTPDQIDFDTAIEPQEDNDIPF